MVRRHARNDTVLRELHRHETKIWNLRASPGVNANYVGSRGVGLHVGPSRDRVLQERAHGRKCEHHAFD